MPKFSWLRACAAPFCLANRYKSLKGDGGGAVDEKKRGGSRAARTRTRTTREKSKSSPEDEDEDVNEDVPIDQFGSGAPVSDFLEAIPGGDSLRYIDYVRSDEWEERVKQLRNGEGEDKDWDRECASEI